MAHPRRPPSGSALSVIFAIGLALVTRVMKDDRGAEVLQLRETAEGLRVAPSQTGAEVAKLADAPDLGSGAARHRGSSPLLGTSITRDDQQTTGRLAACIPSAPPDLIPETVSLPGTRLLEPDVKRVNSIRIYQDFRGGAFSGSTR